MQTLTKSQHLPPQQQFNPLAAARLALCSKPGVGLPTSPNLSSQLQIPVAVGQCSPSAPHGHQSDTSWSSTGPQPHTKCILQSGMPQYTRYLPGQQIDSCHSARISPADEYSWFHRCCGTLPQVPTPLTIHETPGKMLMLTGLVHGKQLLQHRWP